MLARSYLYVPGNRPDRFPNAMASGADAVVFDLEDAVPVSAKDDARSAVGDTLQNPDRTAGASTDIERWVRINTGPRGVDDLVALGTLPGLKGIFLPKATPEVLANAVSIARQVPICALVESAKGVLHLSEIAELEGVVQLALGEVDLVADLGMMPSADGSELDPVRVGVVVASAAHGCLPPVGPVWTDIRDIDGLATSTRALRRLGFAARQAIHPNQIESINIALTPTQAELERAAHLVELGALAEGGVCVDEDGRMIDEAVLRSARRLLGS